MNPNTKAKDILNDINKINKDTERIKQLREKLEKGF